MVAKSSRRRNLSELPPSTDKEFWEGAKIHSTTGGDINDTSICNHHFIYLGDSKIRCRFCGYGGLLKVGSKKVVLLNGKSYKVFAD